MESARIRKGVTNSREMVWLLHRSFLMSKQVQLTLVSFRMTMLPDQADFLVVRGAMGTAAQKHLAQLKVQACLALA